MEDANQVNLAVLPSHLLVSELNVYPVPQLVVRKQVYEPTVLSQRCVLKQS